MKPIKVTTYIYRGSRPDEADYKQLRQDGFRAILNLEDNKMAILNEFVICEHLGLQQISMPMSEWKRPSPDYLNEIADAMQLYHKKRIMILMHCLHGEDRTGYAIMSYRIKYQGWSIQDALKECRGLGHKWLFYLYWRKSIYKFAERIRRAKVNV